DSRNSVRPPAPRPLIIIRFFHNNSSRLPNAHRGPRSISRPTRLRYTRKWRPMMHDLVTLLAQASANPQMDTGLVIFMGVLGATFIIVLAGIVAGTWTQIHRLRHEGALKQKMIDRGMSAEDIVAVQNNRRPGEGADDHSWAGERTGGLPCACEA